MKAMKTTALAIALSIGLAGCATNQGQKQSTGMVIGGALGGLLGSQVKNSDVRTAAIIAGTLAGAAIGGAVGQSMDATDRMMAAQTLEGVRTGVPSAWHNPDSGVDYQFTPTRTYETSAGPCREYTMDALIEGKRETVRGTACRQPDGTWRVQG